MRLVGILMIIASAVWMLIAPNPPSAQANGETAPNWWEGWSMEDPRLSQPIYEKEIRERLDLEMSDGVVLRGWVRRPEVPPGVEVPVILHLTPYLLDRDNAAPLVPPILEEDRYVARGYAIVSVELRGSGHSEGCIDFQGERDRKDFGEILDGITAQPWAADSVGAIGVSWEGTTLNAGLVTNHPALRTIVPIGAITDWYRWNFLNGVQWYYTGYTFNLYGSALLRAMWAWCCGVPPMNPEPADLSRTAEWACAEQIETQREGIVSGAAGLRSAWWDERDFDRYITAAPSNKDTGVLVVHGYQDWGVRADHLTSWIPALEGAGYTVRTLLGQWVHDYPDRVTFELDDARAQDTFPLWDVTQLRWFDYWLKSKDTEILEMPPVITEDSTYTWHEESMFQPSQGPPLRVYLNEEGTLSIGSPGKGRSEFVDNGQAPMASADQGQEASYYLSEPLEEDLRYMGPVTARLDLSHSSPTGHVGVTLYDVNGDSWFPVHYGFANYNLRNSPYSFDPLTPGQRFQVEVPILLYDVHIVAGHRLGIAVGNLVEQDPYFAESSPYLPPPSGGTTVVHHGADSYIELPTLTSVVPAAYPTPPPDEV